MKIKNILIVEDEALIADQLAVILEREGYTIAGIVDEAEEVFAVLEQEDVDLIFLDINLAGAMDGIDIAHQLKAKSDIPFLFLSSNTEPSTLKRMSVTQPLSFLTKPFQKEAVLAVLELAKQKATVPATQEKNDHIFVKNGHLWEKVRLSELLYIEAQDNYIALHTAKGRKMVLMSMKTVEEQLDERLFVRIHRSYIVNVDAIDTLGPKHILVGTTELPLSASGKELLMERISKF